MNDMYLVVLTVYLHNNG